MKFISNKKTGRKHILNELTGKSLCRVERGSKRKYKAAGADQLVKETCAICLLKIEEGRPYLKGKNEKKPTRIAQFYQSWEWKRLRYEALKKYGAVCMLCGATKEDGKICVDHIKSRKRFPELEMEEDNLQILCNSCNMGKGSHDETDHRPKKQTIAQ